MHVVNLTSTNTSILTRSDSLVRFYHDVRKYKIMSVEEETEWVSLYKNGNSDEKECAKNELINSNIRFVIAMAKKYGNESNLLDLINEGVIAMIEALEKFDPTVGIRFLSYAVWYVRREINTFCMKQNNVVRKNNLSLTYHAISKATNDFVQKEFRQPTLEELQEILMDEYNINIKNINDILETRISSIDERYDDDDDTSIGDILLFNNNTCGTNEYDNISNDDFNKKFLSSLFKILSERETTIIKMVYGIGYNKQYELREIADELNMSYERVRQLKYSIIEKMKTHAKKLMEKL